MVRGNRLKGSGLRAKFNPDKHPRGYRGRFIETPDQVKPTKKGLGKARLPQTETGSRKIGFSSTTRQQKLALLKSFKEAEQLKQTQIHQDFQKLLKTNGGATKVFLSKLNRSQLEGLVLALGKEQGNDVEGIKLVLKRLSDAQLRAVLEAYSKQHSKPEVEPTVDTEPKPEPAKKKTKRSPEDIERDRAAKEAEKKAKAEAKEAEKARKAEEKAAKEAEKLAKIAASDAKARGKVADLLNGKQYKGVETLESINRYSIKVENGMPVLPKEPTARPKVTRSNISFDGDKVEIWKDQAEYGKHTGGFKVRRDKGYVYAVEIDGKEVVLNRNQNMFIFEGERVHGVPSIHNRLREIDNDNLVSRLAESMQHVENHIDRSIKAPAIDWSETYHGKVDKDLLKLNGAAGEYGGAEIHHIDQWAKKSFKSVTDRLDSGEITLDQAKEEMKALLVYMNDKTKAGGSVYVDMWRIDPSKLGDRDLVILPAGAHNFTSTTLYSYLHPEGIHPETGKRSEFGIPITGDSGREYFDGWNRRFWGEYYRREAYIMRQEINRRVSNGTLSMDEVKHHWETATAKQDRDHTWQKQQSQNIKPIKKTILEDFLGERKFWTGKYKD